MASTRWITDMPMGTAGTVASCHGLRTAPPTRRFNLWFAKHGVGSGASGDIGAVRSKGLLGGGSG